MARPHELGYSRLTVHARNLDKNSRDVMFIASDGKPLATTITGSLPRPQWFTENLKGRTFLAAFKSDAVFREQYADAVAAMIADQQRAGLDIVSDGEMRFDMDVGGRSWFGYLFDRMDGLVPGAIEQDRAVGTIQSGFRSRAGNPGDILREFVTTLLPPKVAGPVSAGALHYDAVWRVAQRVAARPVKMGSCSAQMIDRQVIAQFYEDRIEQLFAFSDALNAEHHRLADAGCAAIQIEEPCLHGSAGAGGPISPDQYVEAFNREVAGLRAKTEVWCHTCWGNPFAQNLATSTSYRPVLDHIDRLDADVITVEATDSKGAEILDIAAALGPDKKLAIGVVSHRRLQIEQPDEIADLTRLALAQIGPERLILSSDCGFGRQGMSRTHAFYKMVAIVRGANIVRRELGLPEAECSATNPDYDLG